MPARMRCVDEAEILGMIGALTGVVVVTAGPGTGAPEVAWGDSFCFYDPDDAGGEARMSPFATLVVKDYPGFDTESRLDRPGVFRLNLPVGRERFTELFGFPPADVDEHRSEFDAAAADRLVPHPVYGGQGWVSVVQPGPATEDLVREIVTQAYGRARRSHERRHGVTS